MKFLNKNKVLFTTLMLTATGSAFAAKPDVTFYGELDVSVASTKTEIPSTETLVVNSGAMNTSYIGVKTKMDLGDGLSGLMALETFLRVDTGDSGRFAGDHFYARNAYVGLEGGFGTVKLGRNTTPYFISVILTNPFVGSFGYGPSIMHSFLGGLKGDSGWSNSVAYSMPSSNGFDASFLYSAGEVADKKGVDKIGANVFYRSGKFTGTLAYQAVDPLADGAAVPASDTQSAGLLGATYDLGAAKLFGQYQSMKDKFASGDVDYKTVQAGVSVPFDKASVLISYANTKVTGAADYKRNTLTLAYTYKVSDKVGLYAAAYNDDFSNVSGQATNIGFGGRFSF